jgi:prepilin-type N-terminal cleavage/methylation domain-containing protein
MVKLRARKGFTLLELIVVVLIIGILSAFAVPQYMRSLENNKAEDSAALLAMVSTTNRMYAMDHGNQYTVGTLTNSCNSQTACPASGGATDPCSLVSCKYLAQAVRARRRQRRGLGRLPGSGRGHVFRLRAPASEQRLSQRRSGHADPLYELGVHRRRRRRHHAHRRSAHSHSVRENGQGGL